MKTTSGQGGLQNQRQFTKLQRHCCLAVEMVSSKLICSKKVQVHCLCNFYLSSDLPEISF